MVKHSQTIRRAFDHFVEFSLKGYYTFQWYYYLSPHCHLPSPSIIYSLWFLLEIKYICKWIMKITTMCFNTFICVVETHIINSEITRNKLKMQCYFQVRSFLYKKKKRCLLYVEKFKKEKFKIAEFFKINSSEVMQLLF